MLNLKFRPVTINDSEFIFQIKKRALRPSIELTWGPWNEEWQRNFHKEHFRPQELRMIQLKQNKKFHEIGCLGVDERQNEIFISSLFILPEFQNMGIGTQILKNLQEKACQNKKLLLLDVLQKNIHAQRLYQRLGFEIFGETSTHFHMRYNPLKNQEM